VLKRIRDPLYNFIEVPGEHYRKVLDHRLVQRLRWISQLPLEQLVYPAAQHSRFEHSLGVMHLARRAAQSLVANSLTKLRELRKLDPEFKAAPTTSWRDIFIDCAGLSGLLHDLGHAPFSHTMEDACTVAGASYNHEDAGLILAKIVLADAGLDRETRGQIVLRVLNKKITNEQLGPLEVLLRTIIDGPIDVDKGDYILRDGYHCGVVYGSYDPVRLWDNVVVSDRNRLGVDAKGALEAWSLRLARYKMNECVYKHHVRNITDALLIEIISKGLERCPNGELRRKILPLETPHEMVGEDVWAFCSWTDNTLIQALAATQDHEIKKKIEHFQSRKLYKRCFGINLSEDYPGFNPKRSEDHAVLRNLMERYQTAFTPFNYIVTAQVLAPVMEDEVQKNIRVRVDNKFIPLANFLGFPRRTQGADDEDTSVFAPKMLRVFVEDCQSPEATKKRLFRDVQNTLEPFRAAPNGTPPPPH